jgi:hypothetical protein
LPQGWAERAETGLEEWYAQVYETPFDEFSERDLARACRQKIEPEWVVPEALNRIEKNPRAGFLYEGELAASLVEIPPEFWRTFLELTNRAIQVLELTKQDEAISSEVRTELKQLERNLSQI